MKNFKKLLGVGILSFGMVCSSFVLAEQKFKTVPAQPVITEKIKQRILNYCNYFGEKIVTFAGHRKAGVSEEMSLQHYRMDVEIHNKMMELSKPEAVISQGTIEQVAKLHSVVYKIPEEHFHPTNVIDIVRINVRQCMAALYGQMQSTNPFSQ